MAAEDVNSLLSQLAKEIDDEDRDCDTVLDLAERVLAAGASPEHQQARGSCPPIMLPLRFAVPWRNDLDA